MLTRVTSSTDEQFTTTAAVKGLLGIVGTSHDALIDGLITRVSRWAETRIGRGPLTVQSYRETLAGFGDRRLALSRQPVRAVTALWDTTDTGSATTYLSTEFKVDHEAGFLVRDEGWEWDAPNALPRPLAIPLAESYWAGEEREPWLCDYVAGWTYNGISTDSANYSTAHGATSTGRTLPEDIEEAVRYRVVSIYEGEQGVVERRVGDLQVKYAKGSDGMAHDPASELLEQYRSYV